ncbi:hypothetical protein [Kitasatospora sp. NBC_01539]|jgi:hypothetical protein|uniref:hypothetical protein n=1 Tax=Kitasatospora sp. NBC_01539 TaxID=2903577 RepID=UPI00386014F6
MAGIEDGGAPVLQPCPSCGLTDLVVGVPAAYHAGRDSERITTRARFAEPETTVTRSVTTSLADALEPAPTPPASAGRAAGMALLVVSVGTFAGGAVAGHWFGDAVSTDRRTYPFDLASVADAPRPDYAFLGWISGFALLAAVLLLVGTAVRRSAHRRRLAGRPAAERVWSQGWYCLRCGTVHFPAVRGRAVTALTLREFRTVVWEAGGYGHLAEDR